MRATSPGDELTEIKDRFGKIAEKYLIRLDLDFSLRMSPTKFYSHP